MNLYYAVAYNWGMVNRHGYVVQVGTLEECNRAAEEERVDRAGKYGIAVYPAGVEDPEPVSYYCSRLGEAQLGNDARYEAARCIGFHVLAIFEGHQQGDLPDSLRKYCQTWVGAINKFNEEWRPGVKLPPDDGWDVSKPLESLDGIGFEDFGEVGQ